MFIVLDKIIGEERKECMINTDHIVEISPVTNYHDRYGYTCLTLSSSFDGDNETIYTDCKLAHIKEAMCGLVAMNEIKNYEPVVDIRTDCTEPYCTCGHDADEHISMGTCSMCRCDMFEGASDER